jgi:hypothetical protein
MGKIRANLQKDHVEREVSTIYRVLEQIAIIVWDGIVGGGGDRDRTQDRRHKLLHLFGDSNGKGGMGFIAMGRTYCVAAVRGGLAFGNALYNSLRKLLGDIDLEANMKGHILFVGSA